jgi:transcriptional regulator with XRE-family HTH domain
MATEKKYQTFAVKVAAAAKAQDLSQTQVAKVCGVTPQSVQRWFTGSSLPRPSHMPSLSKALGISVEELISGVEELHYATQLDLQAFPPSMIKNLYESQEALNAAITRHQQAVTVATKTAYDALILELSYEGYYPNVQDEDRHNSFSVERDDVRYDIELHVRSPSVGDTIRVGRRHQVNSSVPQVSVYAFWSSFSNEPRFFIVPARMFLTREGIALLKAAAAPELIELQRNGHCDTVTKATAEAMAHAHPLWDFVDQFDIADIAKRVAGWELVRDTH